MEGNGFQEWGLGWEDICPPRMSGGYGGYGGYGDGWNKTLLRREVRLLHEKSDNIILVISIHKKCQLMGLWIDSKLQSTKTKE